MGFRKVFFALVWFVGGGILFLASVVGAAAAAAQVPVGSTVKFSVTAEGTAPFNYQWKKNGNDLAGATDANLTISNIQNGASGSYSVVVSNRGGTTLSDANSITVVPASQPRAPGITQQPINASVPVGANITFTAAASGSPAPAFQWIKDGTVMNGATSATLLLTNVATSAAGTYTVMATNSVGHVYSVGAKLTVLNGPAITTQPLSQEITEGLNVTFGVMVSGGSELAYQWKKNGVPLAGATSSFLTLSNVLRSAAGTYTVDISNRFGSITSNSASLQVDAATASRRVWFLNGTSYTSSSSIETDFPGWQMVGEGDFNTDGQADIIWRNKATGQYSIGLMRGATQSMTVDLGVTDVAWEIAGTGDFNGDGQTDILWQNVITGQHSVWLMRGTNNVGFAVLDTTDPVWRIAGTGDFNGDGHTDILWQNLRTGQHSIWFMRGTLNIGVFDLDSTDPNWRIAGVGDFNRDGKPDIIWQNSLSGQVSVWLMNRTTYISAVDIGAADSGWQVIAPGDFNDDGQIDLLLQK